MVDLTDRQAHYYIDTMLPRYCGLDGWFIFYCILACMHHPSLLLFQFMTSLVCKLCNGVLVVGWGWGCCKNTLVLGMSLVILQYLCGCY
jgi:hypothetical protein